MKKSKSTNEFKKVLKLIWKQKKTDIIFVLILLIVMTITLVAIKSTNGEMEQCDKSIALLETKIEDTKQDQIKMDTYFTANISTPMIQIEQTEVPNYYIAEIPLDKDLQLYTYNLCQEKQIDYDLVLAVMWNESRFNANALNYNTNGTYDHNIMQINDIMKDYALEKCNVTDLENTKDNILVGTTRLSEMVQKYGESQGLIAYGLGENGMKQLNYKGKYSTQSSRDVLSKRDEIRLYTKTN